MTCIFETPSRPYARRGVTLAAVLVALMVVTLLAACLMQSIVARQRQLRVVERRAQAQWLAESGVERGAARLRRSPEYAGETWRVPMSAEDAVPTGPSQTGRVEIKVEAVDGQPRRRRLVIEAAYPDHPVQRVTCRKQILVDLPSGELP